MSPGVALQLVQVLLVYKHISTDCFYIKDLPMNNKLYFKQHLPSSLQTSMKHHRKRHYNNLHSVR